MTHRHTANVLKERIDALSWNANEVVPILPVVPGTRLTSFLQHSPQSGSVAWKIVENGFSALSTLDAGYYGSGIYFTSSVLYATPYYATKCLHELDRIDASDLTRLFFCALLLRATPSP